MKFFSLDGGRAALLLLFLGAPACSGTTSTQDAAADQSTTTDAATGNDAAPAPDAQDAAAPIDSMIVDVLSEASAEAAGPDVVASDAADASTAPDVSAPSDAGADVVTPRDSAPPNDVVTTPDAPGAACSSDGDCTGEGMRCGFLIANACSATGSCVMTPPRSPCGAIVLLMGCGCDGSDVHWNGGCAPAFPSGYAPAALSHMGACP